MSEVRAARRRDAILGISVATVIISLWSGSLIFLLTVDLAQLDYLWVLPASAWQLFLYTGLFITAHDAMHGAVFRINRRLNNAVGSLAVILYALFSYDKLQHEHWAHHRHPGSEQDPDFHDGVHRGFVPWYYTFLKHYVSWRQLLGMAIAFNIMRHILHIPLENLLLFWIAPSVLSTLQLFYFGTYLPHRETDEQFQDAHHAHSNDYSTFWSFLTCYHFGYHWEHHAYPHVPWWRLPAQRRKSLST